MFIASGNAFSEIKKVKDEGVVYNLDLEKGTASVGQNYELSFLSGEKQYTGTLSGNVVIASSVKHRGKYYTVTSIDPDAFYGCGYLVSVTIPETVKELDSHNFYYKLWELREINVAPGNEFFQSVDGVLFSKDMTRIIRYPQKRPGTTYTIPSSVVYVEESAFSFCSNLMEIILPESVRYIGDYSFEFCHFKNITLPSGLLEIGKNAFSGCQNLTSITIPEKATTIGTSVFSYCNKLESIVCRNMDLVFTSDMIYSCEMLKDNIIYDVPANQVIEIAEKRGPDYQYKLAMNYMEGKVVQKDIKLAMEWLNKAASAGHVMAQMTLGDIYMNGKGVEKNFTEGIKWYSLAADNGNVKAMSFLGDCYYNALGVKQDLKRALGYYRSAAEQGDGNAVKMMGYFYYNGKEVAKDYAEAEKWYLKSARDGDPESAFFVALILYEGKGIERDAKTALEWAKKAVDGGIVECQWLYCKLAYDDASEYMNGGYYNSAISGFTSLLVYDKTNTDAYINRGYCYLNIKPADYSLAEADFNKALELDKDNTVAINNLRIVNEQKKRLEDAKNLWIEGNKYLLRKDYVNAVDYYSKSISVNNADPYPYTAIGYCYFACEQYADAIGFFDKALAVQPGYENALKGKEQAAIIMINKAISNAANSYSNSLNNTYNSNVNNSNSSYGNNLNDIANKAAERNQKYGNDKYEMYMRLYEQEQAEADSYYRRYETYGNIDDLNRAKACQSRANDYREKANIWK